MRHKKITNVLIRFKEKRQLVILQLEENGAVFLSAKQIKQGTDIDITEVELLINSSVREEFYKIGEKMFDGKICEEPNRFLKDFWITLNKDIQTLREENADRLKPFQKIIDVTIINYKQMRFGLVKTDLGNTIWIKLNWLLKFTRLEESELHIMQDSFIYPVYYKQGEVTENGMEVYKDNVILKTYEIRFFDQYAKMHENFENSPIKVYRRRAGIEDRDYPAKSSLDDLEGVFDENPEAYWSIFYE